MNKQGSTISPIMSGLASFALVGFVLLLLRLSSAILVPLLFAFFLAALALPAFR